MAFVVDLGIQVRGERDFGRVKKSEEHLFRLRSASIEKNHIFILSQSKRASIVYQSTRRVSESSGIADNLT